MKSASRPNRILEVSYLGGKLMVAVAEDIIDIVAGWLATLMWCGFKNHRAQMASEVAPRKALAAAGHGRHWRILDACKQRV